VIHPLDGVLARRPVQGTWSSSRVANFMTLLLGSLQVGSNLIGYAPVRDEMDLLVGPLREPPLP
jgi:hypothetical protein